MPDFDVVDLGPTDHVPEGETAPDFTRPLVTDEFWEDRSLAGEAGNGPVVLVFTTMVGAFVAEYVLTELRDRAIGIGADGDPDESGGEAPADGDDLVTDATVLAVSISSPYEISRFLDEKRIPYGVFSDPANGVAEAYGVVHDLDGMAGIAEARPAVFVLDEARTIRHAWVATEWPSFPDFDALESALARC